MEDLWSRQAVADTNADTIDTIIFSSFSSCRTTLNVGVSLYLEEPAFIMHAFIWPTCYFRD